MSSEIEKAMKILTDAMQDTDHDSPLHCSLAHSWHCNMAMMCYDAITDANLKIDREGEKIDAYKVGNDAASRFMKLCFNVETGEK